MEGMLAASTQDYSHKEKILQQRDSSTPQNPKHTMNQWNQEELTYLVLILFEHYESQRQRELLARNYLKI